MQFYELYLDHGCDVLSQRCTLMQSYKTHVQRNCGELDYVLITLCIILNATEDNVGEQFSYGTMYSSTVKMKASHAVIL